MNTLNPINAVTDPDPYPYYREVVEQRPLYYDETLKLWVASGADKVTGVLTSDLCRVRPAAEPVPAALINSPAGRIFQQLVRQNDGARHMPLKHAVSATLGGIDPTKFNAICTQWAETLQPNNLSEYAFQLPVYVMGDLLGVPHDHLEDLVEWVRDFVRCISPLNTLDPFGRGQIAAAELLKHAQPLFASQQGLFGRFGAERVDPETIVANGIGFLSQAYEATAGLIGNTILALARRPELRVQLKAEPSLLPKVIEEVSRIDAPVQNTRRYVAEAGVVAGQAMKAGDAILVILAAANYDPAANPNPERFDIFRTDRQIFTFGVGVHACPGQNLAVGIASAGVGQLLRTDLDFSQLLNNFSYQESLNARIPLFRSNL